MKKTIRLSESELISLINKLVISEQTAGTPPTPAKEGKIMMVTTNFNNDALFKTGDATPDPNSKAFNSITSTLMKSINDSGIPKPLQVKVQGGASLVGQPGFDNMKLADQRRNNMISYLSQNIGRQLPDGVNGLNKVINFIPVKSVVGVNKVKDSPEAKKEQFVKITYPTTSLQGLPPSTAVDTTSTSASGNKQQQMDLRTKGLGYNPVSIRYEGGKQEFIKFSKDDAIQLNQILKKYGVYVGGTSFQVTKSTDPHS